MSNQPTKKVIIPFNYQTLEAVLQLPPAMRIIGHNSKFNTPGVIELMIEGAGYPTPDGCAVLTDVVPMTDDAKIDWSVLL